MTFSDNKKTAIIGLGYVGLTLAVAFAKKHESILGMDINLHKCKMIREGKPPFFEEGFEDELKEIILSGRLEVVNEYAEFEDRSIDNWIVTVGTPLMGSNCDLSYLNNVIKSICKYLNHRSLVVLRSTVGIGTSVKVEEFLKTQGLEVDIAMCPERTIEGNALSELYSLPQIIGADNKGALIKASKLFSILETEIIVARSTKEAELAKLACNSFRDLQFAFANELALLGEQINIDVNNAISIANRNYPRSEIPKPGTTAGPCLVKDSLILDSSFSELNLTSIAKYAREINMRVADWVIKEILSQGYCKDSSFKLGILGLAFKGKPETSDIRDSMAISIRNKLILNFENIEIYAWDPVANFEEAKEFEFNWKDLDSIISTSKIVVLQNNHVYFKSLEFIKRLNRNKEILVLDFWNQIDMNQYKGKVITFGGIDEPK